MSFGVTENTLRYLTGIPMVGDYGVWGYFQSIDSKANDQFKQKFYTKYGEGRAIDDPMEATYVGVYLWAQAVRDAGSFSTSVVVENLINQSYTGPSGLIYVDPIAGNYRPVRIGRIESEKEFKIIWNSEISVVPVQYAIFRTAKEWDDLIKEHYKKWGNQWFRGKE